MRLLSRCDLLLYPLFWVWVALSKSIIVKIIKRKGGRNCGMHGVESASREYTHGHLCDSRTAIGMPASCRLTSSSGAFKNGVAARACEPKPVVRECGMLDRQRPHSEHTMHDLS